MHLVPETQAVGPVHPIPPHCPHSGDVPPVFPEDGAELVFEVEAELVLEGGGEVELPLVTL